MRYVVGVLAVLASLSIGYELGSRKAAMDCKVASIGSKFTKNEVLMWASRSLHRETIYYELTTLPDSDMAIDLIQSSAREGMEQELSFLLDLRSSMGAGVGSAVQSTIDNATSVLAQIHNKRSQQDAPKGAPLL